jgi:hypothetical protein
MSWSRDHAAEQDRVRVGVAEHERERTVDGELDRRAERHCGGRDRHSGRRGGLGARLIDRKVGLVHDGLDVQIAGCSGDAGQVRRAALERDRHAERAQRPSQLHARRDAELR